MTKNVTIAPGVTLRVLNTDKFKTGCFSINFLRPHTRQDAPLDALLPSVLLRATENYPDIRSISMHLDELYGASFGTAVRKKGEVKLVGFYTDFIEDRFLPEGERVFRSIVEFIEEVIFHPYTENGCFCRNFVEGEKQNLLNAIDASLNDKRSYAISRTLGAMCPDEAYGVPRLGFREDAEKITAEALWEHYQDVLRTSRIEIFYAGSQPAEVAAEALKSVFGREERPLVPVGTERVDVAGQVKEISEAMDVTQGKLVLGFRTGITCEDRDFPALVLLNAVYGAGVTSKLFVNVREKMSLCYYASSSINKYKGVMLVSSGVAFENYEVARKAILHELEECRKGNITEDELESARRQVLSALKMALDDPARLDDFYVGMAIADSEDIPQLAAHIAELTAKDLSAAAGKLTLDTVYFLKGEEQ